MTLETPRSGSAGGSACPEAERLAEYVDHVLPEAERAAIERHLVVCPDCRSAVVEAARFREQDRTDSMDAVENPVSTVGLFRRRWIAASVAALAAAAAVVLIVRLMTTDRAGRPELAALVAAVSEAPTRPLAGRLTGGFPYAAAPSVTRGASTEAPAPVRIAAASIEAKSTGRDTPDDRAALGTAYLVVGDLDRGIAAFEDALSRAPGHATFSSDLSAGYLARWQRDGRQEDVRRAIDAADRALRADPNLLEARFNRALALAAQPQPDRSGFADYLQHDSTGPWADEARARQARQ